MGPPLALYLAPGSSSMAPHIALNEVGAAFEVRPVSFARGGTGSPEFLAINPEGKVPVLLADGARLTEVAAILYYLARRFPEAGLMPWGDPLAEAEAVSWMSFIASAVHPARRQGLGRYSIADIHLFRLYWRFLVSLKPPAGAFPRLQEHHDRMMRRPAVNRTLEAEAAIGYELPS